MASSDDEARPPRAMSEHELNPAGRLYLYLTHVATRNGAETLDRCLGAYAGVDFEDLPALWGAARELAIQLEQTEATIEDNPGLPGQRAVTAEVERVRTAFRWGSILQGQVESFRGHYDEGTLRTLEMWSESLNQRQQAQPIEAAAGLAAVQEALDELRRQLREDASIDDRVRATLIQHIGFLSTSIDQFYIGGVDAMLAELDRLIGRFARDERLQEQAKQNGQLGARLAKVVSTVTLLASLVSATHILALDASALLQLEAPPVEVVAPAQLPTIGATDTER